MSKWAEDKKFENFMTIDLRKGPAGGCQWLSSVLNDKRLNYEQVGILVLLGENLGGSAFSIEYLMKLKPDENLKNLICNVSSLEKYRYLDITIHRDKCSPEEIADYWEYVIKQYRKPE